MGTRSFKLICNNLRYGPAPKGMEEIEQRLTVAESGRVWFSARNYRQYVEGKGFCRRKQLNIGPWKAQFLLRLVESMDIVEDITDCGYWKLTIAESGYILKILSGSLIGNEAGISYGNKPVSVTKIMRRYIPVYGLFGFDGDLSPDYEGKKEIYLFAEKWIKYFSADNMKAQDFDYLFGEECIKLGFQMDGGAEFLRLYPGCFNVYNNKLQSVINEINDVDLLGSAAFSYWRGLTHWSGPYELNNEIRGWFILVLKRIKELTKKK